jgi:hypothetical protein
MPVDIASMWQRLFPATVWPGEEVALRQIEQEIKALRATARSIRSVDEIWQAHDLLHCLILDQELFELVVDEESHRQMVLNNEDVLCWMLKHEHNPTFLNNLSAIQTRLEMLQVFLEVPPQSERTQ